MKGEIATWEEMTHFQLKYWDSSACFDSGNSFQMKIAAEEYNSNED